MSLPNRPDFSALLFLAITSLLIASCAGGGGATEKSIPPTDLQRSPISDVLNLYSLAPDDMPIGVAVPAGRSKKSLLKSMTRQTIVNRHFSQITAENIMKPVHLQPGEGTFFFDHADALVAYAVKHDKTIHGHTLIWHYGLPNWMNNFTGDAADWTTMMTDHITAVVSHYAEGDTVVSWDVINEAISDTDDDDDGSNDLRGTIWLDNIGTSYLAAAFRAANAADPEAEQRFFRRDPSA
jgi:endo-1,4-beta-xylanase